MTRVTRWPVGTAQWTETFVGAAYRPRAVIDDAGGTAGVAPSLHVDYKHTTIKQYHKEGQALRTETMINDTRDFDIGKRLVNLPALREIGFQANRRLLGVQRLDHDPITGTRDLHTLTDPVTTAAGARVPGLKLGQQRSQALLFALLMFRLQPDGFGNRDLCAITAELCGLPPHLVSAGQMTYDLRRLKAHGLIENDRPHPPLPGHRHRPAHRDVHDPRSRPSPTERPGPARRVVHTAPTAYRSDGIPHRDRRPHQRSQPHLMTTTAAPHDET